jgi:hypothetical protein
MNSGGLTGGKQGLNQEGKVKGPPPVGRIWLRGKRNFGAAKAPLAVARRRKIKKINVPSDVARTEPALRALKTLSILVQATASSAAAAPKFLSPTNAIGQRDGRPFILPSQSADKLRYETPLSPHPNACCSLGACRRRMKPNRCALNLSPTTVTHRTTT